MNEIDRRRFLRATGVTALGTLAAGDPAAPALSQAQAYESFQWSAPELTIYFEFLGQRLRQTHLLPRGKKPAESTLKPNETSDLETALHCSGEDCADHHGMKFTGGMPGGRLLFVEKRETVNSKGKQLTIVQRDPVLGLEIESFYETFAGVPAIRRYARVTNKGAKQVGLEYISSAMLHNFASPTDFERQLKIHFAFNSWQSEGQWHALPPSQVGFIDNGQFSLSAFVVASLGTWSTEKYLPLGMIENTASGLTWFWQIDHNGSWHWEISNHSNKALYLYIGGPDEQYGHAWKSLEPGASYETVPVAIGCVEGGFGEAVAALTRYRRHIRRHFVSGVACPVIFNDYMNCLEGDPTAAKELPLINAASEAGCEYFVIDAGWYAELNESWWDSVGVWQPSKTRWPDGLKSVLDHIRQKKMIPGLWLEPEVVGIHSPLKNRPDDWFFMRHGRRVIDHERYLLDFRNPEVRAHLDGIVHRLVSEYGVGYIKMDYNVDGLLGTGFRADSFGQGLLDHCRALLNWLDGVLDRYPTLMVENCASGGGRMDYAMLSRLLLQSSSDQTDYKKYPAIMTGASAGVLPEQLAAWSYPLADADSDQASFNMVSAMLCRIHQSGHLAKLKPESLAQVKKGIEVYKAVIREQVPNSAPFYPLGMPSINDPDSPIALGMRSPGKMLIAVWRLNGGAQVRVPGLGSRVELLYPEDLGIEVAGNGPDLNVRFPRKFMACVLRIA